MKILVIPDIHLKPWIFDRAAELMRHAAADKAVCLMDIPDDWHQEKNIDLYIQTFDSAISFQRAFPDTLWCYGNHDLSYVWNQTESGYSYFAHRTVYKKLKELWAEIKDKRHIAYVHRIDNVLFMHGGLTNSYVMEFASDLDYEDTDAILKRINGFGCIEMWYDASPIWCRPQYYTAQMYRQNDMLQIVGHTPVEQITRYRNMVSCDVFSTYRDGRPIGTQEFLLIDTKTWDYEGIK